MIWHIINAGIFIIAIILSANAWNHLKKTKEKYTGEVSSFEYQDNPLQDTIQAAGNQNELFKNTRDTKSVIDRYLISYDNNHPYLFCHLTKTFDESKRLTVYEYNQLKQLINIRIIADAKALCEHPMIKLKRSTRFVNIVHSDEAMLQEHFKQKASDSRTLALRQSIALFFALIPLSYVILSIMITTYTEYPIYRYMTLQTIGLGLALITFSGGLSFLLSMLQINARHAIRGGANE